MRCQKGKKRGEVGLTEDEVPRENRLSLAEEGDFSKKKLREMQKQRRMGTKLS